MPQNIFLLTGENTYALFHERQRWVKRFVEKHGEENLTILEASQCSFSQLLDAISVIPFIAERRLVVVSGIPRWEKEEIHRLPELIHPQVILLFIESHPDKRFAATKALFAIAGVRTFDSLTGAALQRWMQEYMQSYGARIGSKACEALLGRTGERQESLSQELAKLALFTQGRKVTVRDIEELVVPSAEMVIWKFTDQLASGRAHEALLFARLLLERGHSVQSLWNILLWTLRNLVSVYAALNDGQKNIGAIAKETGVPFLSVRSLLPLAQKMDARSLQALVDQAVADDMTLKTGGWRATSEEPEELLALLDRLVLRFVTKDVVRNL